MPAVPEPPFNRLSIEAGRKLFLDKDCWKCHGKEGHGQLPSDIKDSEKANSLDSWGNLSLAADLTSGMLHGGRRHLDVYRRISSGINGSKMPAFDQAFAKEPANIWHLAHFVLWVSEGNEVSAEVKER
jgi:mono/diheme cytochrome c family protein